jgi:hypothetical protein
MTSRVLRTVEPSLKCPALAPLVRQRQGGWFTAAVGRGYLRRYWYLGRCARPGWPISGLCRLMKTERVAAEDAPALTS